MAYELVEISGSVLTFRISGKLKHEELKAGQSQAAETIRRLGKARFLVLIENYESAEKEGDWGDVSFQAMFDPHIEKIAIVGDKKWEELALLFSGKGIRRVAIEYFQPSDLAKAKAWLAEP